MGTGRRFVAALLALAFAGAVPARSPQMRIQYAEPVAIVAGTGAISFDAYGRRFNLELTNNDRVTSNLPAQRKAQLSGYRILRGVLSDQPRSWVRLTEHAGRIEGAIWDGQDLYVVATLADIAANLTTPVDAPPGQTVVYRLSDTIDALPRGFCPDIPGPENLAPNNGLAQFRGLVAELALRKTDAASLPLQIEISLIGDASFQANFGANSTFALLARHNVVDGIFAEQVGLLVLASDLRLIAGTPDPFTSTDPSTLLGQVSSFRSSDAIARSLGITHLMTGRVLDGSTAGIARRGGVCNINDAVSLTEASFGTAFDGLIMAHELGHNFGAVHDGTGVCSSTPDAFLMAPTFNTSGQFSQCSLDTMRPVIETAQCITTANYGDVEMAVGAEVTVELDNPVVVPFTIRSIGTQPALDARLVVTAPPNFTITATSLPSACSIAGDTATCAFGTIPAGEDRSVGITLLPATMNAGWIEARASATNNPRTFNDRQSRLVHVTQNADAGLTMAVSSQYILLGDSVDFTIVVSSLLSHATQNTVVQFYNYQGNSMRVDSATVAGATCTTDSFSARCNLGDLAAGTQRTITVRATSLIVGSSSMVAVVSATIDAASGNNSAGATVNAEPLRDIGFRDETPSGYLQFGMPYEFKATVYAGGVQPVENARVEINAQLPTAGINALEHVTLSGVACTKFAFAMWRCDVGTLAPGETRQLSIKGVANAIDTFRFHVTAYASAQDNLGNDTSGAIFNVRYGLDASVQPNASIYAVESLETDTRVSVWSNGLQPSANAVMILELPMQMRVTRFYLENSYSTCEITDPQHLRCVYSMPPTTGYLSVHLYVVGDSPGSFQGRLSISMAGDEDPSNDSAPVTITINPHRDAGVRDITMPDIVFGGRDVTVPVTIFTATHPVPGVVARISTQGSAQLSSVTTSSGSCTRVSPQELRCPLGDLPAGATVNLDAVVTAGTLAGFSVFGVSLDVAGDTNSNNNQRSATFVTAQPGDLRLVSAASTVTAPEDVEFSLPTITVWHPGQALSGKIRFTLPAGVTIQAVSGSVTMCVGATNLECDIPINWLPDAPITFDLRLLAANAMTGTVTARVTALNDFANANDEASIAVTVTATTPPPSTRPPSNGGGGGGRIEWPAAILLGLLLMRRQRQRVAQ